MKNLFLLIASLGIIMVSVSISYYFLVFLPQTTYLIPQTQYVKSINSFKATTTHESAYQQLIQEKKESQAEILRQLNIHQ